MNVVSPLFPGVSLWLWLSHNPTVTIDHPGADTDAHRIDGDDQHDAYLAGKHGENHTA